MYFFYADFEENKQIPRTYCYCVDSWISIYTFPR